GRCIDDDAVGTGAASFGEHLYVAAVGIRGEHAAAADVQVENATVGLVDGSGAVASPDREGKKGSEGESCHAISVACRTRGVKATWLSAGISRSTFSPCRRVSIESSSRRIFLRSRCRARPAILSRDRAGR